MNDVAKILIKSYCQRDLQFQSLVEIGAFLWQQQLPVRAATTMKEVTLPIKTRKRRKTSGELSSRQLSNCAKSILRMESNSICVNNADDLRIRKYNGTLCSAKTLFVSNLQTLLFLMNIFVIIIFIFIFIFSFFLCIFILVFFNSIYVQLLS